VQETQCGALEAHVYLTAHDNEPIKPGGAAAGVISSDSDLFSPSGQWGISGAPLDDRPPKLARRLPKTPSCNQNWMRGADSPDGRKENGRP
jgi:hypothetical protein